MPRILLFEAGRELWRFLAGLFATHSCHSFVEDVLELLVDPDAVITFNGRNIFLRDLQPGWPVQGPYQPEQPQRGGAGGRLRLSDMRLCAGCQLGGNRVLDTYGIHAFTFQVDSNIASLVSDATGNVFEFDGQRRCGDSGQ